MGGATDYRVYYDTVSHTTISDYAHLFDCGDSFAVPENCLVYPLAPGTIYHFRVVAFNAEGQSAPTNDFTGATQEGNAVPVNDEWENSVAIPPWGTHGSVAITEDGANSTINATDSEPTGLGTSCQGATAIRSVWFQITPTRNGTLSLSTNATTSGADTVLELVSGDKYGAQVACQDDAGGLTGLLSWVSAGVTKGTTYHVMVSTYNYTDHDSGTFTLTAKGPVWATGSAAPDAPEISTAAGRALAQRLTAADLPPCGPAANLSVGECFDDAYRDSHTYRGLVSGAGYPRDGEHTLLVTTYYVYPPDPTACGTYVGHAADMLATDINGSIAYPALFCITGDGTLVVDPNDAFNTSGYPREDVRLVAEWNVTANLSSYIQNRSEWCEGCYYRNVAVDLIATSDDASLGLYIAGELQPLPVFWDLSNGSSAATADFVHYQPPWPKWVEPTGLVEAMPTFVDYVPGEPQGTDPCAALDCAGVAAGWLFNLSATPTSEGAPPSTTSAPIPPVPGSSLLASGVISSFSFGLVLLVVIGLLCAAFCVLGISLFE